MPYRLATEALDQTAVNCSKPGGLYRLKHLPLSEPAHAAHHESHDTGFQRQVVSPFRHFSLDLDKTIVTAETQRHHLSPRRPILHKSN